MCEIFESLGLELFFRFALTFGLAIGAACELVVILFGMFISIHQADHLMELAIVALFVAIFAGIAEWRAGH